jgi:hypothetical protein
MDETKLLKYIKEILAEHEHNLNVDLDDQYRDEFNFEDGQTCVDGIRDLDIDSMDFNGGFECGYLRALEEIIAYVDFNKKKDEK